MSHKPIQFNCLSFALAHKTCFENLNATIFHGQHIGIIGKNGCGKSSLLNILAGLREPTSGSISVPDDAVMALVPQVQGSSKELSGGQVFNHLLSHALAKAPNILMLDEPTNHLDRKNRTSLLRMLRACKETIIMATHDEEVLRQVCDVIWHIDHGVVKIIASSYDDYVRELHTTRSRVEHEIALLNKKAHETHSALMKEQTRAKKSRQMGERNIANRKWPTIVSTAKAKRAEVTTGGKKAALSRQRKDLTEKLSLLRQPEIITPKFHFPCHARKSGVVLSIQQGSIGYNAPLIAEIDLFISYGERIAIVGDNGSGKSTLLKAIRNEPTIKRSGFWQTPPLHDVGYLDQNYQTLSLDKSVMANISAVRPDWSIVELRSHLNDFLFRKNEEVNAKVFTLSGGERARLSLCVIAANTPKLLLLDEITNNVDKETRDHITEVLSQYEGTLMLISHDPNFLKLLAINRTMLLTNGKVITTT